MTPLSTDIDRLSGLPEHGERAPSTAGFELPALPFERHSLEPAISRAQIDLLYSYYHRSQIDQVNRAATSNAAGQSLATLATGTAFSAATAAGEAWNLTAFWHGLTARPASAPASMTRAVNRDFGSWGDLASRWRQTIASSDAPWSWLVMTPRGELQTQSTRQGERPADAIPLLAIALMPDAYRLDFSSDRSAYFDALWPLLNWEYAALCLNVSSPDESAVD
ncbi:superoxide dismutase [Salinicola aestuarinus]|uniref:superoxide dismutase n=1 Tax=Salinicola aestuarinus TaxID=1949082 RepID=UPI000DA1345D|nr:Fe-Mn family superoxide dismutase [Salinicola aestuarinus]